ncbi:triphosphoribosyl-dephospho-CoA synthase MdcB [Methylobacterium oxalidis]|uniref:Probable 2-(5''-triphosphoribosyl)-3'-dephosphocoenzyme-A synthase n=1 Tax=Methylobacterium oxalidis TaxID=944322 RepID=A0A512J775_9HYPH|nr:triphosphoribosyl-dephospho-CoA synthase MdcB [Methylobacterium oxalidis]GEP05742.1 putative 2-(5''-triphosphoribosyl)-3'-dephosphocoenzyme-A synthase [Methylobacterium oxalidis]GJE32047.1 2-(5''-triphosphoribosyl)-3'-dephosphocoenzyme-A synthase [Methylobacterium oxalidis]GLS67941.1 putative 2-(5''-triphosphoribosyl)-3'-dephosphocoenzyme-A synthase [Methylobacterium oxalidis]
MSAPALRPAARPATDPAEDIARRAVAALRLELETYPKPGLVSHVDSGSHADMDAGSFRASAAALEPFFADLARAGAAGEPMAALRRVGIAAEAAMRAATGGVNTHRGAIFGLGLLCAAAGAEGPGAAPGRLGALVRARYAHGILDGPELLRAPGARARRRHGVGGAPAEAAAGFPTLYGIGLPALRRGRRLRPGEPEAARVEACLALIAHLEDTNLLHRGGAEGYAFARAAAARLVAEGGVGLPDWRERATGLHGAFVARNLSPGGAADLLAMTLFVDAVEGAAA